MAKLLFSFFSALVSVSSTIAFAQHDVGGGYPFNIPHTRPAVIDYTSAVSFPLTNVTPEVQTRVNVALEYAHGFWTFEAERNLREAILLHPEHPMPYVLAAFVQTIFSSGDFERANLYFDEGERRLSDGKVQLSEHELMWFQAIAPLFDGGIKTPTLQGLVHVERLQQILQKFPDDLEAKAFLALGNWIFKIGQPGQSEADRYKLRAETDDLIEDVITAIPNHPVHHYKIHLWNTGKDEFRALDSARANGPAQPRTAHLWHMPAHIFSGTYDSYFAMKQVEIAHRVDHKQMLERRIMPTTVHNYYHNYRDFGLRLTAMSGRILDATRLSLEMLRFGRLEHAQSRNAMVTLADATMRRLEQFQLWSYADEIRTKGYFDNLSVGVKEIDLQFQAAKLRQELRGLTYSNEVFAANRELVPALIKKIERINNELAVVGPAGKSVDAIFQDSRLWYEVAMRRPSGDVPEYYLKKLIDLKLTPASQLMLLAQELGHEDIAAELAKDLRVNAASKDLTDHLNLLTYYLNEQTTYQSFAANYREPIETAERNATFAITPPSSLLDLQGFTIAAKYPAVLTRIFANAESRHRNRVANPPTELKYLADINLEAMGPINPQHYKLPEYSGDNASAAAAFASPARGRYKAYVFAIGTSCEACNKQLLALNAARADLAKLGIELTAITTTGEVAHDIPTLADLDGSLHKTFGIWDQFVNQALHGLILIDSERTMLWDAADVHPLEDVKFLLEEFERVIRLN